MSLDWYYMVKVEADTLEQADQVMTERIDPDEELGFDYRINVMTDDEIDVLGS